MPDCEKPSGVVGRPRIMCSDACRVLQGHWFAHWSREPCSQWSVAGSPAVSYAELRSWTTWANRPISVRHPSVVTMAGQHVGESSRATNASLAAYIAEGHHDCGAKPTCHAVGPPIAGWHVKKCWNRGHAPPLCFQPRAPSFRIAQEFKWRLMDCDVIDSSPESTVP